MKKDERKLMWGDVKTQKPKTYSAIWLGNKKASVDDFISCHGLEGEKEALRLGRILSLFERRKKKFAKVWPQSTRNSRKKFKNMLLVFFMW